MPYGDMPLVCYNSLENALNDMFAALKLQTSYVDYWLQISDRWLTIYIAFL